MKKEHVMSIEQMKELESLGFDVTNASMVWRPEGEKMVLDINRHESDSSFWETEEGKKIVRTYTLHDVLEILPNFIDLFDEETGCEPSYELRIKKNEITYELWFEEDEEDGIESYLQSYLCRSDQYETMMDCAFMMMKWIKESGHLDED